MSNTLRDIEHAAADIRTALDDLMSQVTDASNSLDDIDYALSDADMTMPKAEELAVYRKIGSPGSIRSRLAEYAERETNLTELANKRLKDASEAKLALSEYERMGDPKEIGALLSQIPILESYLEEFSRVAGRYNRLVKGES